MSFKYALNKEARNNYIVNMNHILIAVSENKASEKNDIEEILKFQNEVYEEDGEVSDNAYFKVDSFDKILKKLEWLIIVGIIISTLAWGFSGLWKPL